MRQLKAAAQRGGKKDHLTKSKMLSTEDKKYGGGVG